MALVFPDSGEVVCCAAELTARMTLAMIDKPAVLSFIVLVAAETTFALTMIA